MKIYTKKGDDGSTGLFYGGRVPKDAPQIELNGAVDEAQAFLGLARSRSVRGSELDQVLIELESDLWILMAEVATQSSNRPKLQLNKSLVSLEMVSRLERLIDKYTELFSMPKDFIVPGQNQLSAYLDVARTVVRRAERLCIFHSTAYPDSQVGPYLNRLSDLIWTLARWQEGEQLASKSVKDDQQKNRLSD